MHTVRVTDLVVEQTRQDEADAGGASTADIGKHSLEVVNRQGGNISKNENNTGQDRKANVAHGRSRPVVGADRRRRWQKRAASRRSRAAVGTRATVGAPLQNGIDGSAAGMNLQGNRERDEDHDGQLSDVRRDSSRV